MQIRPTELSRAVSRVLRSVPVMGLALAALLIAGPLGSRLRADEPAEAATTRPAASAGENSYAKVHTILSQRCGSCHSGDRAKGDLALDTPEAIKEGGKSGAVLVAGKPDESVLIRRLRMSAEERGHMPPRNKPQLTPEQIKTIEDWVASGASFEKPAPDPAKKPPIKPAPEEPKKSPPPAPKAKEIPALAAPKPPAVSTPAPPASPAADALDNPKPVSEAAVQSLRSHLVYVEVIAQGSNRIRLDFAAAAKRTKDAVAAKLIEPVLAQLDGISLARCGIGDETAALLAKAPRLRRLDLRNTHITDKGLASLEHLATLHELILTQTKLTDAAIDHLMAMPALEHVYLWRSGLSADAIKRLRTEKPALHIEAGDAPEAKAKEVEPAFKLSGEAPPPVVAAATKTDDAPKVAVAAAPVAQTQPAVASAEAATKSTPLPVLKPVNATCPISGSPVSAEFAVVFKTRVIGFCCQKCAAQFLADPDKFETKVVVAAAK